jgi:CO dehydrogenase maturation factor
MKIAIGGKGGTGKTTLAGTLARALAQGGHQVLALDGDSNPNLAFMIGVPGEDIGRVAPLPRDLLVEIVEGGERRRVLRTEPAEIIAEYAATGPDGVQLLVGAQVDHAGKG